MTAKARHSIGGESKSAPATSGHPTARIAQIEGQRDTLATPAPESEVGTGWELRHGRWEDVLADVECDAVICDPPYGGLTHESSRKFGNEREDGYSTAGLGPEYTKWTEADVSAFVTAWTDRCRGWMVALTSDDLIPAWKNAHRAVGRYVFHPIPCVMRGMSVRLCGDGPSSWAVYAMVARPATGAFSDWGTLPGAYTGPRGSEAGGGRGKPDWLMNGIVRDYSRPGDVVVDPFVGWGSTIAAAVGNGRTAIGADVDADAIAEATRRLRRGTQTDMFTAVTT